MTVTYTLRVSNARLMGFSKLLLMWKGSIYKLVYKEMIIFVTLYTALSLVYRLALDDHYKRKFESAVRHFQSFLDVIPLTFVLGFYVSIVMKRWWDQFVSIPWPDRLMSYVSTYISGTDDRGRLLRRTIMRWVNLSSVLVFQSISLPAKKRFPTLQHIVDAGIMTPAEKKIFEHFPTSHSKYWLPCEWAVNLASEARHEGRIRDDILFKSLLDVATIAVYTFCLTSLMGRQYIKPPDTNPSHEIDIYVPFFTLLQFFFYMGWLKVAEVMINPFGEDGDDFEINLMIDRNYQISMLAVDELHSFMPPLQKDMYWDDLEPELPYTRSTLPQKYESYMGSTADFSFNGENSELVHPMETIPENVSVPQHTFHNLPTPVPSVMASPEKYRRPLDMLSVSQVDIEAFRNEFSDKSLKNRLKERLLGNSLNNSHSTFDELSFIGSNECFKQRGYSPRASYRSRINSHDRSKEYRFSKNCEDGKAGSSFSNCAMENEIKQSVHYVNSPENIERCHNSDFDDPCIISVTGCEGIKAKNDAIINDPVLVTPSILRKDKIENGGDITPLPRCVSFQDEHEVEAMKTVQGQNDLNSVTSDESVGSSLSSRETLSDCSDGSESQNTDGIIDIDQTIPLLEHIEINEAKNTSSSVGSNNLPNCLPNSDSCTKSQSDTLESQTPIYRNIDVNSTNQHLEDVSTINANFEITNEIISSLVNDQTPAESNIEPLIKLDSPKPFNNGFAFDDVCVENTLVSSNSANSKTAETTLNQLLNLDVLKPSDKILTHDETYPIIVSSANDEYTPTSEMEPLIKLDSPKMNTDTFDFPSTTLTNLETVFTWAETSNLMAVNGKMVTASDGKFAQGVQITGAECVLDQNTHSPTSNLINVSETFAIAGNLEFVNSLTSDIVSNSELNVPEPSENVASSVFEQVKDNFAFSVETTSIDIKPSLCDIPLVSLGAVPILSAGLDATSVLAYDTVPTTTTVACMSLIDVPSSFADSQADSSIIDTPSSLTDSMKLNKLIMEPISAANTSVELASTDLNLETKSTFVDITSQKCLPITEFAPIHGDMHNSTAANVTSVTNALIYPYLSAEVLSPLATDIIKKTSSEDNLSDTNTEETILSSESDSDQA